MKIIERIVDALGLYDDGEDEILEEEEVVEKKPAKIEKTEPKFEPAPKKSMFKSKEALFHRNKVHPSTLHPFPSFSDTTKQQSILLCLLYVRHITKSYI